MRETVLVTGGAGFIGSHLADELLAHGHRVRCLDNLTPQVHGPERKRPAYLAQEAELVVGDVRDPDAVRRALVGVDAVVHLAAAVGVGQSMYQIREYTDVNSVGTAVLLEALCERPVRRLVVASSMSIYGEGEYVGLDGSPRLSVERSPERLEAGDWEPRDADGGELRPVATRESKCPALSSVYALTKYDQERMALVVGRAYGIPTLALRFFNVYGPRQALSNPYTGVLAIFSARLLNDRRPLVFEDGLQRRDFVHVRDVARACRLAVESDTASFEAVNVASGASATVREIAARIAESVGKPHLVPELTGQFRAGDVRHCFADVSRAQSLLGFRAEVALHQGLEELAAWLAGEVAEDRVEEARAELEARGLATSRARAKRRVEEAVTE